MMNMLQNYYFLYSMSTENNLHNELKEKAKEISNVKLLHGQSPTNLLQWCLNGRDFPQHELMFCIYTEKNFKFCTLAPGQQNESDLNSITTSSYHYCCAISIRCSVMQSEGKDHHNSPLGVFAPWPLYLYSKVTVKQVCLTDNIAVNTPLNLQLFLSS